MLIDEAHSSMPFRRPGASSDPRAGPTDGALRSRVGAGKRNTCVAEANVLLSGGREQVDQSDC